MPVGAHMLLSYLAEPLKQPTELLLSLEQHSVSENLKEFQDWREYYACDALYRNWLKIEMDNDEVSPIELSSEEREKEVVAARQALNASLSLLERKYTPWLTGIQDMPQDIEEGEWLELDGIAMFRLSSGDCLLPDATTCTALTSALYACAGELATERQLSVDISICTGDEYCINVFLRCTALEGDGIGPCTAEDGGLLASVMAAAFKGELEHFEEGVALEVFQLDAWYINKEGFHEAPAKFIVQGLCRRCCIPELILRCMQIRISLADLPDGVHQFHNELVELIASPDSGLHRLFSQQQLQEFLLLEREFCIRSMEAEEESLIDATFD